jgi:hypothetical protein
VDKIVDGETRPAKMASDSICATAEKALRGMKFRKTSKERKKMKEGEEEEFVKVVFAVISIDVCMRTSKIRRLLDLSPG